ncbi:hypothetical protein B0H16DRAFT_1719067 [Mycena metata]|uniref:FAD-binding PCMH-type domain-containing protein n=1 Tax=Mycena metata TaxID=1033252 RepID=A0AAD7JFF5_9AGAR|nr:hypothetical protein B0H16DRAFT_1719067 [Mycena metata]
MSRIRLTSTRSYLLSNGNMAPKTGNADNNTKTNSLPVSGRADALNKRPKKSQNPKKNSPRPTHFLSLPLGHHPELRDKIKEFHRRLLPPSDAVPAIEGLDPSILVDPRRLHLTIGVMTLSAAESQQPDTPDTPKARTISEAITLLHSLAPEINAITREPVVVALEKMGVLKTQRQQAGVLYLGPGDETDQNSAKVSRIFGTLTPHDSTSSSHCISDLVGRRFRQEGFIQEDPRPAVLHCTLINASHRKPRRIPRTFSYREIFDQASVLHPKIPSTKSQPDVSQPSAPQDKAIKVDFGVRLVLSFHVLAFVGCLASTLPPAYFSADVHQRHAALASELGPRLSRGASIHLEGPEEFKEQTIRWQLFAPPSFHLAVVVGDEHDVQLTVAGANVFGLPWLAVSGHHGAIASLEKMEHGVQISLSKLNEISVNSDGHTANIGGGALSKSVSDTLWPLGKQTVTGMCECTSLAGPLLGGGHGFLQGKYGLMIDQLVEARVVLADGTLVTANAEKYPDLFWALRGAGHNFGIVTQVKYKLYDVPEDNQWVAGIFTFTEDKLEKIFTVTNELTRDGLQPAEFLNFIIFMRAPTIDASKTILNVVILYEGSLADSNEYMDQYAALGPVNTLITPVSYPILPSMVGAGINDAVCLKGIYRGLRFPTSYRSHDVPTVRRLYTKFDELTANPAFNTSAYFFEGFSVKAVQAVAPESTAYPERFNIFLTSPLLTYFDARWDEEAVQAGKEMREIALGGVEDGQLNAYINYAHGDEGVEDWYGHETWRIDKLKALKEKYDPHNTLAFYAPIMDHNR